MPRDRASTFKPRLIKKSQLHPTDDLERKILALYTHDNSYQSIRERLKDYYDTALSNGSLSAVTDKILLELKSRQERDLDPI